MQKINNGYLNPTENAENMISFKHCGIKPNLPLEKCGPMVREMYLLHYVIEGKGTYTVGNTSFPLRAGDVFAIFPDDVVSYIADREDPWYFCWIGFVGKQAEAIYERIGINREKPVLHLANSLFLDGVLNCLSYIDGNKERHLSALRLDAFVLEILSAFDTREVNKQRAYVNNARSYMEFNCHERITPKDAAEYVGLEYSYFYKLFKAETGFSPNVYLTNLRMEKAKKLLQANVEIKNIPGLIGLGDVYYFSKLFKRYTGKTPGEYRKKDITSSLRI